MSKHDIDITTPEDNNIEDDDLKAIIDKMATNTVMPINVEEVHLERIKCSQFIKNLCYIPDILALEIDDRLKLRHLELDISAQQNKNYEPTLGGDVSEELLNLNEL
ncbi:hypothetical protein H6P87_00888 [Rickettsia tillamookensis]|uniref:Uncharacterized protein n=1 Tax=Rickettsia tillamookensis TaxID=2761623 RepID=A0A9E6MHS8_9RICK|nr:hypothetical protein [Rickettsia tillamookensis]QQV75335.1 hypothetical protein H6P87_00888 [Rickettsia tillamookensis]